MTKNLRALVLIVTGLGLVAATEPRQPTGRWVVDFDDAQCVASRDYGSKESPLTLVIESPPAGNIVQVGVLSAGRGGKPEQLDGEVVIGQRPAFRTSMIAFTPKAQNERLYLTNLPVEEFAFARTASVIAIHAKGGLDEHLAIPAMQPLMKVLDDCVADLRKVWNVAGKELSANLRGPVGNLQGILRHTDYPDQSIDKEQSGTVTVALLIDETGKVADCTVIGTSRSAFLDVQSCAIVKIRAKFQPAIGMDGKPAKGSFVQRVTWRLE